MAHAVKERTRVGIMLDEKLLVQLKIRAAQQRTNVSALLAQLARAYLKKRARRMSAVPDAR